MPQATRTVVQQGCGDDSHLSHRANLCPLDSKRICIRGRLAPAAPAPELPALQGSYQRLTKSVQGLTLTEKYQFQLTSG